MHKIQLNGIEPLTENEKKEVNSIVEKAAEKFDRELNNDFLLKIALKQSGAVKDNPAKKKKYSVHAELSGAMMFEASAEEWDLKKVLHMVIGKLDYEIEHKYHSTNQHKNSH
jgi:ribosome-associated translation inhibitor RaiA